jgi:hypothetical protein
MKQKFVMLAGVALILGAAATAWGNGLTGTIALQSGPSFTLGYRVGRFLPTVGLEFSRNNWRERAFIRDTIGAPESSYTRQYVNQTLSPELGTRIYLGPQAGGPGDRLTPYIWAGAFATFYTDNRYINGQPDTASGTNTYRPDLGGRVDAGAELRVLPNMSLNGEVGLCGTFRSYREERTQRDGYYIRNEHSGFSLSVITGLGVNFQF